MTSGSVNRSRHSPGLARREPAAVVSAGAASSLGATARDVAHLAAPVALLVRAVMAIAAVVVTVVVVEGAVARVVGLLGAVARLWGLEEWVTLATSRLAGSAIEEERIGRTM